MSAPAPSPLKLGPCISAIVFGVSAASRRKVGSACGVLGMNGIAFSVAIAPSTMSPVVVAADWPPCVKRSLLNSVPVVSS